MSCSCRTPTWEREKSKKKNEILADIIIDTGRRRTRSLHYRLRTTAAAYIEYRCWSSATRTPETYIQSSRIRWTHNTEYVKL